MTDAELRRLAEAAKSAPKQWQHYLSAVSPDSLLALLDDRDRLAAENARLKAILISCDTVMDTAAIHGVDDILPPAYRDSWATAHMAVREALARKEG